MSITLIFIIIGIFIGVSVFLSMLFRTVVLTNEVHIVQKKKTDVSYGKGKEAGNVYFNWPSWIPILGIERIVLPVSIFSIKLDGYVAYDSDKVPFVVDVMAFFKIDESSIAAQRISSFDELKGQLNNILQGSIRRVLAQRDIISILEGRGEFALLFTTEVNKQLADWGVRTTQNVELMNIEDCEGEKVIFNIMEVKKSSIEKESRIQVAQNMQEAQTKEIEASKIVEVNKQKAQREIGEQTAEKEKLVGIASEVSKQEVATQSKITNEKEMEVKKVIEVKQAEINKDVSIVRAEEQKQTEIIKSEGLKLQTINIAEGKLEEQKKQAQGIELVGVANAAAEKAMQMAPVEAQIRLAEKIASMPEYIQYLLGIKGLEVGQVVGVAKADALKASDLKVIANTGTPNDGINNLMDLFSSKGGSSVSSMLENLNQTEAGQALYEKILGKKEKVTGDKKDIDTKARVEAKQIKPVIEKIA